VSQCFFITIKPLFIGYLYLNEWKMQNAGSVIKFRRYLVSTFDYCSPVEFSKLLFVKFISILPTQGQPGVLVPPSPNIGFHHFEPRPKSKVQGRTLYDA